jgi:ADP-ribose pyrophosphatase YjhB (NUDIX family)
MLAKDSYCSYCGRVYQPDQVWPRLCAGCGNITYRNPLPVAVVLVPVDGGLLVIRRGIEPELGKWALPGGYVDIGESWQQAGAREVFEETGVTIAADEIVTFGVHSSVDRGLLIVLGLAGERRAAELPPFTPTSETTERAILQAPEEMAFPLHTEAVAEFFAGRQTGRQPRRKK